MAIYDVTGAFDDLLEPITLEKVQTGEYIDGEWVESRDTSSIQAVIQPMDYSEVVENDPTAPRDIQAIEIWTESKLTAVDTVSGDSGDIVVWDNRRWKIIEVTDFDRIGGYHSAIAYIDKGR